MVKRPLLIHLTTTDITLELLLGPQLEAFAAAGYDVVGLSAPGPFVAAIEARGVRHIPLNHATRSMAPVEDVRALGEIARWFRRLRPAIVHTHNPKPGLYGRLAARATTTPAVVNTVHGLYALPTDPWLKRAIVYGMERVAASCSGAELVQNVEDIATLRRLGIPQDRITLLGNGIDLDRFTPTADSDQVRARLRDEWSIDHRAVVVGAVGRLVLEKGYAELLEAWRSVAAGSPDARLVIIGPDDAAKADALPHQLRESAERNGVVFLGHRDDIERCYHAMDVFVLASHREGFPRSVMEAAAAGLPTVATDIRGCRQAVEHQATGLLVPVGDAAALASALLELVAGEDLRRDMGARARRKARVEFDQNVVIERTLGVYDRLLSANQVTE